MNWKNYEHYIYYTFKDKYPFSDITFNKKVKGVISGRSRQIDLFIQGKIAGEELFIIVDCKHFNKKIDIQTVESFLGFVKDVRGNRGILITNKGFTKSAYNRAYNDQNNDIKLEIIEFKQLYPFQGPGAIIHREYAGGIIQAPDGWVVDGKRISNQVLAVLLPYGLSIESAAKIREVIFCNITLKKEIPSIDKLIEFQEEGRLEFDKQSTLKIEQIPLNRKDGINGIYRETIYAKGGYIDYTIFIEFDDFIFYTYLAENINLRGKHFDRLLFIVNNMIPANVNYQKTSGNKNSS